MALREKVEVVEVSSHLAGRLVEGRDLPTLYSGHLFGERGLLNASGQPKLLPYALTLTYLLLQTLSPQFCAHRSRAPLFGDLALHYAVDDDGLLVNSLPVGATPMSSPRSWAACTMKRVTTLSSPATWSSMIKRRSERAA